MSAEVRDLRFPLWKEGEERATEYLDRKGYRILERNFRCHYGEIDIVALDGDVLCFIEVKTRSSVKHGLPCQAVNRQKIEHIKRCAYIYMGRRRRKVSGIRIEVVEVLSVGGRYFVRHIRDGIPY